MFVMVHIWKTPRMLLMSLYCPVNKGKSTTKSTHHNENTALTQSKGQCSETSADDCYMMEIVNKLIH